MAQSEQRQPNTSRQWSGSGVRCLDMTRRSLSGSGRFVLRFPIRLALRLLHTPTVAADTRTRPPLTDTHCAPDSVWWCGFGILGAVLSRHPVRIARNFQPDQGPGRRESARGQILYTDHVTRAIDVPRGTPRYCRALPATP